MQNSSTKSKSDLLRLSVTLFVIAGLMALLVAFVNNVTAPVIEQRSAENISKALNEVLPEADSFVETTVDVTSITSSDGKDTAIDGVWKAVANGENIGYCVKVLPQGYGGIIETIVALSTDGKVLDTCIVSMSETSGIGTKIQDENFLSQFIGKSSSITAVTGAPSNNEIAVISGATKSSKAYLRGINAAISVVKQISGGDADE